MTITFTSFLKLARAKQGKILSKMDGKSAERRQSFSQDQSYIKLDNVKDERCSLIISAGEKVGILADILTFFKNQNVNLSHLESRPSRMTTGQIDFFVNIDGGHEFAEAMIGPLKELGCEVHIIGDENEGPWFPRKISDLDRFAHKTLEFGQELSADHPGFTDLEYRKRRHHITTIARDYKHGSPIPRVDYTEQEIETWRQVYTRITKLYPTHACKEFNTILPLLEQHCGYGPDNIPQIQDISDYLKGCSGFRLRPVAGLLSSRDFLNGLAFRVFHSTQYIRHHSKPFYTPEPDCAHELLGHVPLFANQSFAEFSQEIGLLSLGVSDEDIERLATCYWFTIEFGLCQEGDSIKAYGAGLLSSYGELEYCLSDKPKTLPFDPATTCLTKYPVTEYQPTYFVASSFESAKQKLREFGRSLSRSFALRYDPYSETIEILKEKDSVVKLTNKMRADFDILVDAMEKLK